MAMNIAVNIASFSGVVKGDITPVAISVASLGSFSRMGRETKVNSWF